MNRFIDINPERCIGCGTCSYVCPAKRPVTQTMNLAKAVWQKNKHGGKK